MLERVCQQLFAFAQSAFGVVSLADVPDEAKDRRMAVENDRCAYYLSGNDRTGPRNQTHLRHRACYPRSRKLAKTFRHKRLGVWMHEIHYSLSNQRDGVGTKPFGCERDRKSTR